MTVITRFAPSPTGYLHIGGVRTALFSWLYARQHKGQFILRIEDTDQGRSTEASVQAILEGMAWLGLQEDQGPFYQTQRMARYRMCVETLLQNGYAYKCSCSKERLEKLREAQSLRGEPTRYDGHCRDRSSLGEGEGYVIRFKVPGEGVIGWHDLVKGPIEIANKELDDFVLVRADGMPTYNFAVVVDDWDMAVSHVLRGDDHVSNTPKQIHLFNALGVAVPAFGHVPMILGEDGKRLSKRHGAVSVLEFKQEGYLPEALLNYLVRLGWSHGDQEIFSLEEMIAKFDFAHVSRSPAAFNFDKLKWINQHYLKTLPAEYVAQQAQQLAKNSEEFKNYDFAQGINLALLVPMFADRVATLGEFLESVHYFYQDFEAFEPEAAKKHLRPVAEASLSALSVAFKEVEWTLEVIGATIQSVADQLSVGMGKVGMPLRVAVTGGGQSPAIDQVVYYLGREKVLSRIEKSLAFIEARKNN